MINKIILKDEKALTGLQNGVNKLNNAVKNSLGPSGLNIIIDRPLFPQITSDGVTAVKEVFLEDRLENIGSTIVKEASIKTSLEAGDGTTTSVVIANALIDNAVKYIVSGYNSMKLVKGIKKAEEIVVKRLKEMATPVKNKKDIYNIAKISCRDNDLAKKLSDVIYDAGKDIAVAIEDSQVVGVESETVNGFEIERGFYSPFMATNMNRMEAELKKPSIIIFNKRITRFQELAPSLDLCIKNGVKDILIIANDFENDVIGNCVVNKSKGIVNAVCIKAPMFYKYTREALEDIALFTNAKVIDIGFSFEKEPKMENFGKAEKILVTKDRTTIIATPDMKDIKERVAVILEQEKLAKDEISKDQLKKRANKLLAKAVTIKVGACSDYEQQELKDRVDDAVRAIKSAMDEGIIIGGGVSLLNCVKLLDDKKDNWGFEVVKQALVAPIKQIAVNSGFTPELIIEKILLNESETYGMNFLDGEYVDLIKEGIVDPLKVVRAAFQNAISVASVLLTANTTLLLQEDKLDKKL